MYDDILYPTDGSPGSEAAASHVRELASAFGATVHVLHVVDAREGGLGVSGGASDERRSISGRSPEGGYAGMHDEGPSLEEVEAEVAAHAEELLGGSDETSDGYEVTIAVESGTPHSVILGYADEHDVDLVVMGTQGRTGVERYLIGSVAERVVRLSNPPVVTVRPNET